jgi:hypothetical protein
MKSWLSCVPTYLKAYTSSLHLHFRQITCIDNIDKMIHLEELFLPHNKITTIYSLRNLHIGYEF